MEKLIKVVVHGRMLENGQLDSAHREAIAVYVDPFEKFPRTCVLSRAYERFPWLLKVADDQRRMYWIDEEGDQISIYVEEDMETCISLGGKVPKVYIDLIQQPIKVAPINIGFTLGSGCPFMAGGAVPQSAESSPDAADEPSTSQQPRTGSSSSANNLHVNVVCDGCDGEVRGFRYKCVQCRDYDLCHKCESEGKHKQHIMYRMPEPQDDLGIRQDRRMFKAFLKTLRKGPRDENAPSCRRSRHQSNESSNTNCHVESAIRHAHNAEKFASVGVDLISNFAQHFANLMDPFGVTLDAASAQQQRPTSQPTTPGQASTTSSSTSTQSTNTQTASSGAAASGAATSASSAPTTSTTATPTATTNSATNNVAASASDKTPAGTSGKPEMMYIEDDVDDFVAVPSMGSSNSSSQSSNTVVGPSTNGNASNGTVKRQNLDFD